MTIFKCFSDAGGFGGGYGSHMRVVVVVDILRKYMHGYSEPNTLGGDIGFLFQRRRFKR